MVNPDDCIVYLETVQSGTMKTLVEVLKDVLKECSIVVDASGLSVMSMSHNKCSIVFLKLDANSFEDFRCDEEVHLGVEMLELFRLMKTVTNQDVLSLYVLKHNSDKLGIEIDNADKKTKTVFSLNLKPLDYHHFEIDDIDFKSVITMPSAYFQSLMRNMNQIADYVTIHSEGDKLSFHCQGRHGVSDDRGVRGGHCGHQPFRTRRTKSSERRMRSSTSPPSPKPQRCATPCNC